MSRRNQHAHLLRLRHLLCLPHHLLLAGRQRGMQLLCQRLHLRAHSKVAHAKGRTAHAHLPFPSPLPQLQLLASGRGAQRQLGLGCVCAQASACSAAGAEASACSQIRQSARLRSFQDGKGMRARAPAPGTSRHTCAPPRKTPLISIMHARARTTTLTASMDSKL